MQENLKAAAASGDIATLLKLMANTSELTAEDYIQKTIGNLLFTYYTYLHYFHLKPVDLEDLVDGLLFIASKQYVEKQTLARSNRNL